MMMINGYDTQLGFDNMLANPSAPVKASVCEGRKKTFCLNSAFLYLHLLFHSEPNRGVREINNR